MSLGVYWYILAAAWLTPNHLAEFALVLWCFLLPCVLASLVLGITCWGGALPQVPMMIQSYCAGCRLWPLLLRLSQLRRTIQYHYFHFDRSPLQELFEQKVDLLRTQGRWPRACYALGPAGSSSRYVSVRLVRFSSQDGLVVFWLLPFPWYSVGSIWSSPVCLWAVVFAEFFSCLAFGFSLSFF